MIVDNVSYHRLREQQCREMAQAASDPDIRRRHEELADLHAGRAMEDAPTVAAAPESRFAVTGG